MASDLLSGDESYWKRILPSRARVVTARRGFHLCRRVVLGFDRLPGYFRQVYFLGGMSKWPSANRLSEAAGHERLPETGTKP
jgi:hypothetical protein